MRVLVIEDETALREDIKQQLERTGVSVDAAADGPEGLFAGLNYSLDAAIVDVGLPSMSGLDVIRQWRARKKSFPVVVLTARNRWQDKVEGLEAGADDYVCKPFEREEVLARLRAIIRRANGWAEPVIACGPFVMNMRTKQLTADGTAVELTSYEYRLLEQLMLNAGATISGTRLAEHMYDESMERESNVVAQLVCRLRKKLDPMDQLRPIETVYGGGYRFAIRGDRRTR